jgi:hypothetical protein
MQQTARLTRNHHRRTKMTTQRSSLLFHGFDLQVADDCGDRLESLTRYEKTCFLSTVSQWVCSCAHLDDVDWGSLGEFIEEGCGDLGVDALPMIKQHFDYCDPDSALHLLLALTYQIQEGVYAPENPVTDDDDLLDLDELLED